jgi:hypothetical protein
MSDPDKKELAQKSDNKEARKKEMSKALAEEYDHGQEFLAYCIEKYLQRAKVDNENVAYAAYPLMRVIALHIDDPLLHRLFYETAMHLETSPRAKDEEAWLDYVLERIKQ